MTAQVTDPFFWKGKKYVFNGADDIYSLFDPEAYGLHPEMMSTACYKGFIITFRVRYNQLYIDELTRGSHTGNVAAEIHQPGRRSQCGILKNSEFALLHKYSRACLCIDSGNRLCCLFQNIQQHSYSVKRCEECCIILACALSDKSTVVRCDMVALLPGIQDVCDVTISYCLEYLV